MQAAFPTGCREAPEPLPTGYDGSWNRQTPLLPVRGLQIPRGGLTLPQRGTYAPGPVSAVFTPLTSPLSSGLLPIYSFF